MLPNPTRKFVIFISSSFRDLKEIRQQLLMEILRIGHIPSGMEFFHAGHGPNRNVIEKAIQECDIFVLLGGARYGEIVGGTVDVPYVEWEYDLAQELGKPILVFLLENAEYESARNGIAANDPERQYDERLDAFRVKVQNVNGGEGKRIVESFSYKDVGDLRGKLSDAVHLECANLPGGWVSGARYDELMKRVHFDVSVSANPFFGRFADRLNRFGKLSRRTLLDAHLKRAIARHFWKLYLPKIALDGSSRLFFESGSSIAYLSEEFMQAVTEARWGRELCKRLRIGTNNILTFLDFTLIESRGDLFNVVLEPKGPFEPYYGATFGELAEAVELPFPTEPESLHPNAVPLVETVVGNLRRLFDQRGMVLMTASGVELDDQSPFCGPHVGSYYNKLVKRCLLQVGVPAVIFLDQDKFPYPFKVGKCHPVCGPDFQWKEVRENVPIALALACDTAEKKAEVVERFAAMGFRVPEAVVEEDGVWSIIGVNQSFSDAMNAH